MPHKIIFISHPIRGSRVKDVCAIWEIMEAMRRKNRALRVPEHPIAPYVLHAQVLQSHDELADYRVSLAEHPCAHDVVAHDELHLCGDDLTREMLVEAAASFQRGIPVLVKGELLVCNPLAQSFTFAHACVA